MSDRSRLAWLRTPDAVRERCNALMGLAEQGALPHFAFDPARLDAAADYVAAVIRQNYPDLAIPYHARYIWGATAAMLMILDRTLRGEGA